MGLVRQEAFCAIGRRGLYALLLALLAAGCSNNDDDNGNGGGSESTRGELIQKPPTLVGTYTALQLLDTLGASDILALLPVADSMVCDVAIHRIEYRTVGGKDEATTATGALMVPTGTDPTCSGARPIVLYAHGTTTDKAFDLTDVSDSENAEALYLAAFFAAQGYIVVAPNYTGYAGSTLGYHPYLVGEQQAKDTIDALKAARSALPTSSAAGTTDGGKLFVTGYSQGGYVAMATQRHLESNGETVTASAPLSGPYALSAFVDAVFFGRVNGGAPVLATFLITAYQKVYGNIYANTTDAFEAQYADGIDSLLPSTRLRSQLYADGDLPQDALFSSTPPDPAFFDITPATTPPELAIVFARGIGEPHLLTNSFRLSYLLDAQANPDGFWPTTTTAAPPANPGMAFRQALKTNDLRNWTPKAPTLLCGGHDDPTVFWLNTQAMQAYWTQKAPAAPVTYLDVDAASTGSTDPYDDLKHDFGLAKDLVAAAGVAQGADDGGREEVLSQYHAGLVAPFCLQAAQTFFREH
jgi:dienelactone hydrolase